MIKKIKTGNTCDTTKLDAAVRDVSPLREFEREEVQYMENNSPIPADEYLTIKQVGALLHVSRSTIWRYSKLGILKPRRLGSRILFARADIDDYLMKEEGHGEH